MQLAGPHFKWGSRYSFCLGDLRGEGGGAFRLANLWYSVSWNQHLHQLSDEHLTDDSSGDIFISSSHHHRALIDMWSKNTCQMCPCLKFLKCDPVCTHKMSFFDLFNSFLKPYPWTLPGRRACFCAVFRIRWRCGCGSHRDRVISWKKKLVYQYLQKQFLFKKKDISIVL